MDSIASHNEFGGDAGNTQYRILVDGQQHLCSLHESNVSVRTRATRVWAVKEFDANVKLPGELNGVWLAVNSSRSHDEQTRRRTTFEEQCPSLYTVSNYGDFMLSLAQLVTILDRIRVSGFVHGDICPLNCLVDTRDHHIKISEIEHARQYNSQDEGSVPSIGAPHFMAIESQRSTYFFRHQDGVSRPPWFQFNFLHDLESVIWMYVWLMLYTLPDCLRAHNTLESRRTIRLCRNQLFDESLEGSYPRNSYIKDFGKMYASSHQRLMGYLEPLFAQANALPLLEGFATVGHLVACYKEVQISEPVRSDDGLPSHWDSASFKPSHYSKLHDLFMSVHNAVQDVDYQAISHVDFQRRAANGLEPPLPAVTRGSSQDSDEASTPSRNHEAATTVEQERNTQTRTGPGARPGKRRAEDEIDKEVVKKAKRAPATARAAKPKASAGRKKQTAKAGSSSRQPAAAAGHSRRARVTRPVADTDRVLRSQTAAKKNKK